MSFEQEWAQLKSGAAGKTTATRLNQMPASPGGGGKDGLVVNQDDLGAVGNDAYTLHNKLRKRADIAGAGSEDSDDGEGSTALAARELSRHNFRLGGELSTALSVWESQVKTARQMCAHISNHLDYSKARHAEDEDHIAAAMRDRNGEPMSVSRISGLVD